MSSSRILIVLTIFTCATVIKCSESPWSGMGVTCQPSEVLIDIRDDKDGCQHLALKVKFCKGTCRSATKFSPVFPYFKPLCECCSASDKEKIPVELKCPDGSRRMTRVETIKDCRCELCGA